MSTRAIKLLASATIALALSTVACGPDQMNPPEYTAAATLIAGESTAIEGAALPDEVLRHIVTFKFKDSAPGATVGEITRRFGLLQDSIPGILAYEHGVNNSPEGLNKGLDHIYQLTFESAAARDAYLPHPAHERFVALLGDVVEDVMVVDYWGAGR